MEFYTESQYHDSEIPGGIVFTHMTLNRIETQGRKCFPQKTSEMIENMGFNYQFTLKK